MPTIDPDAIGIKDTFNKYLAVNMDNISKDGAQLVFNELKSNFCGNYQFFNGDIIGIKNALYIKTPKQPVTVVSISTTFPPIPIIKTEQLSETTFVLGANSTTKNKVELYTNDESFLKKFPKGANKYPPSADQNIIFNWKYDVTNKTWQLGQSKYYLFAGDSDSVEVEKLDNPINKRSIFDNIKPLPSTECKK